MQLQSFFLVFFICLSIASTEPVNAFPKATTSRKISLRNKDPTTSITSTPNAVLHSEKDQGVSASKIINSELSDVILKTNGGSTVFPPPILNRGSVSIQKSVEEEQRLSTKQFLSKHKSTIMAICLMGFTGVVESICYRNFHMYPNMMTGNTVRAMDAISRLHWKELQISLGLIGSYVSGCTLFKFLDGARVFQRRRIPTTTWLSAIAFCLFGLSDVVSKVATTTSFDLMRLLPMATAFGMINCATQEMTGLVTNAATGHYGKIGFGLGEALVMNMLPDGQKEQANKKTIQNGIVSVLAIGSFMTTLITTNLISLWLDAKHPWVYSKLPPLGLGLGIAYTTLLTSYQYFSKKSEKYL